MVKQTQKSIKAEQVDGGLWLHLAATASHHLHPLCLPLMIFSGSVTGPVIIVL